MRVGLTTWTARAAIILLGLANRREQPAGARKKERRHSKASNRIEGTRKHDQKQSLSHNNNLFLNWWADCVAGMRNRRARQKHHTLKHHIILCVHLPCLSASSACLLGAKQLAGRFASAAAAAEGHKSSSHVKMRRQKPLQQPSGAGLRNTQHACQGGSVLLRTPADVLAVGAYARECCSNNEHSLSSWELPPLLSTRLHTNTGALGVPAWPCRFGRNSSQAAWCSLPA